MVTQKDPSAEALANVTDGNVRSRAELLPEERADQGGSGELDPRAQAAAILADSEERVEHPDPDDAQGGHRTSADAADQA